MALPRSVQDNTMSRVVQHIVEIVNNHFKLSGMGGKSELTQNEDCISFVSEFSDGTGLRMQDISSAITDGGGMANTVFFAQWKITFAPITSLSFPRSTQHNLSSTKLLF